MQAPGGSLSGACRFSEVMMLLRVRKLRDDALVPHYAHPGDAGMDLFANEGVTLEPGRSAMVRTGIAIALPAGTEGQVRPRSGLALKHAVTVLNAPGTIDEGYRGELGVVLINHGQAPFVVEKGMKIAQMVVQPVVRAEIVEVAELSDTARGVGGFGSTGG